MQGRAPETPSHPTLGPVWAGQWAGWRGAGAPSGRGRGPRSALPSFGGPLQGHQDTDQRRSAPLPDGPPHSLQGRSGGLAGPRASAEIW